ncbi:MAG: DUF736 domain-containing protein [Altererythrobacter sp.]|nr:DUF736 domain-containing protein [Altererythrobacter sp.]
MNIGTFTRTSGGYTGEVRAFGLHEPVVVLVAMEPSDADSAPDYRIRLDGEDGAEAGFAWKEVGEKAGDYVSLKIVGPLFPNGFIRANLFRADDAGHAFVLSLNAPQKRDEQS